MRQKKIKTTKIAISALVALILLGGSTYALASVGSYPKNLPTNKISGDTLPVDDWNDMTDMITNYSESISLQSNSVPANSLYISNAGNIGIGNTNPTKPLVVGSNVFTVSSTGTVVAVGGFVGGLTGNASTASALSANGSNCPSGQYALGIDASGNAEGCTEVSAGSGVVSVNTVAGQIPYYALSGTTTISATSNLFIDPSTGNVGIATTTPGAKLAVDGAISFTGALYDSVNNSAGDNGYVLQTTGTGVQWVSPNSLGISGGGGGGSYSGTKGQTLYFSSNNVATATSIIYIATSSNVGIGTTNPSDNLQVYGNVRIGTSLSNGCLKASDGSVIAGSCSSDQRLKKDITSVTGVLDKINQLQLVNYYWRSDEYPDYRFGNNLQLGFIAQEAEKSLPELVGQDERGFKTFDYSKLPLYLTEAVKELNIKVDNLSQSQKSNLSNDEIKSMIRQELIQEIQGMSMDDKLKLLFRF